jgi:hypothetical protein
MNGLHASDGHFQWWEYEGNSAAAAADDDAVLLLMMVSDFM